jgi:hypothetical protein
MSYASVSNFSNLPASTKFPAHSVDVGRAIPGRVAKRRLTVLLIAAAAAATEFLFVAVAAYFAADLYHRFALQL